MTGTFLSVVGIVPYIGDLAKAGKLGKWANTLIKAIDLAKADPAFLAKIRPALEKLQYAMGKMGDMLPDALKEVKTRLDDLLGAGARAFSDAVVKTAERLGIPPEKVQGIIDAGQGNRPDPSTYMSKEAIQAHLAKFDDGIVRVASRGKFEKWGTLGPTPGFAMPKSEFSTLVKEAKGDLSIVEKRLGLDAGSLSADDTMIVLIDRKDVPKLEIPSGNEAGANSNWLPGGVTSGGISETALALPKELPFTEIKLN